MNIKLSLFLDVQQSVVKQVFSINIRHKLQKEYDATGVGIIYLFTFVTILELINLKID